MYYLREFASANERHLDSSALGRWIPRPVPTQSSPKYTKTHQNSPWEVDFGDFWDWGFLGLLDDAFFVVEKIDFLTFRFKISLKQNYVFQKMT